MEAALPLPKARKTHQLRSRKTGRKLLLIP
jgi:hypothetical protein